MPLQWTTSAGELLLAVDPSAPRKGDQLRAALRQAIADGTLTSGTRLPSSRQLAADLGLARGVVVDVYEQLVAEGWLTARQGSGTVVAAHPAVVSHRATPVAPMVGAIDLRPARPDVSAFPRSAWTSATRAVLAELPHTALSYGDPRGHPEARRVIAAYLARVRGVRTHDDLVLLAGGFAEALAATVATLVGAGCDRIGVEDPGGHEPRRRVEAAGAEVVSVPVDEDGVRLDVLERAEVNAVLVTPAHQYPMGPVLSPERRGGLVDWARRTGGWVIEDDYDAEFRYDREPVGAMQALAPDRTIYLGSVAKTLAPSIRVGWIVAPPMLVEELRHLREVRTSQLATLDHLIVARLIDTGTYDRHLRTVRRRYRERRQVLLEALEAADLADRVVGPAAGLHAVLRLDPSVDDVALTEMLRERSVEVVPLSRYALRSPERGLVIGFGQPSPRELRRGVEVLAEALTEVPVA
jgi:GntR family transcriptional regulator / MocR family aminotransferase